MQQRPRRNAAMFRQTPPKSWGWLNTECIKTDFFVLSKKNGVTAEVGTQNVFA
jgi:hypothetical protein